VIDFEYPRSSGEQTQLAYGLTFLHTQSLSGLPLGKATVYWSVSWVCGASVCTYESLYIDVAVMVLLFWRPDWRAFIQLQIPFTPHPQTQGLSPSLQNKSWV